MPSRLSVGKLRRSRRIRSAPCVYIKIITHILLATLFNKCQIFITFFGICIHINHVKFIRYLFLEIGLINTGTPLRESVKADF